ncbi:lysylphosphatidylglycerol synthase domain-containing protein [Novipirellula maiorica]|uniref:lysylphosphatidylglycerol synthase domain-containing protein n=1 Tax=Novipirellula maiorica TaxID=1265734 RepID=UPI000349A869|nr:lysylphosphatidylglycerol synthase domain-containing protein [Rhodopirellula maiorica]
MAQSNESPEMSDVASPSVASHHSGGKRWLRIAKILIAIAVIVGLFFAVRSAVRQWQNERDRVVAQIREIDLQIAAADDSITTTRLHEQRDALRRSIPTLDNIRWSRISIAALLYAAGTLVSGMVLRGWLSVLGHRPPAAIVIAAQTLGHIGKYVPGKAMVVVLRVGVLKRCAVPVMPATISVFLETFMMMAVGAAVAGIVIVTLPVPTWMMVAAGTGAVLASIPTMPPVLQIVTTRLMRRSSDLGHHAWLACVKGWVWSTVGWILIGGSFAMIVTAIPTAAPPESTAQLLAIATASISLAMVIGFASLLPGGAGIRELVLTTLLGLVTGPTHALLAAIMARMIFIAVECLMASLAWLYVQQCLEPVRHEICTVNQ